MTKSIFVGEEFLDETIEELVRVGANHYIIDQKAINKKRWKKLRKRGARMAISVAAFDRGGCPLDPEAKKKLINRITSALSFKPDEIWFDHFRFDGKWEEVKVTSKNKKFTYKSAHEPCRWCEGVVRSKEIGKLAFWTISKLDNKVLAGYFAVPFKLGEVTKLAAKLGQDHSDLGKQFNMISPMLYHRMLNKPVDYISEYVSYIYKLTKKPILPIIQIKDIPDNISDTLKKDEFKKAFDEAKKPPSSGVSIFYWSHAVEKNKTDWIRELFTRHGK